MDDRQRQEQAKRLGGLRRFAVAITVLNVLGHTVFGFEPAWAQPLVALATGYVMELLLESVDAWAHKRRPKFLGRPRGFVVFCGFEPAWAQPLVALATGYVMELLLESVDAWAHKRRPKFLGTPREFVDFMLPAHITAMAVAMLLYADEQYWMIAFATAAAIGSQTILRAPVGRGRRHFFNPSNFGITMTLLLF